LIFSKVRSIIFIITCVCSISIQLLQAQGQPGAIILVIEPDAPGRAMGGAHSSINNTPTALYYNPASIAFVSNYGVSVSSIPFWFPSVANNLSIDGLIFVGKIPYIGKIGFSYTNFDLGNLIRTAETSPEPIEAFPNYMRSYSISKGKLLSPSSSIGISIKRVNGIHSRIQKTSF